jgi:hypothetical protein
MWEGCAVFFWPRGVREWSLSHSEVVISLSRVQPPYVIADLPS